jgi:hypothetical protein
MSRFASSLLVPCVIVALLASPAVPAPLFHANSIHYVTGIFPDGSAVGDFDGDGHLDYAIVVDNPPGQLQTARGHGDGTFDPVQALASGPYGPPVAADLNGDGFSDLAVAGNAGLTICYGGPTGLGAPVSLSNANLAASMAIVDLNGDGRLDLVYINGTNIVVRLATGPLTYGPEIANPTGLPNPAVFVTAGDIDEDSKPDLLILEGGTPVAWMKGKGDGTFGAAALLAMTSDDVLFLADLNGDHHLDAIGERGWSLGDGHGNFAAPVAFGPAILGVGDVTGDGAPDLVLAVAGDQNKNNSANLEVFRNDGAGNFTPTWSQPCFDLFGVSIADFNEDGKNDVLVPDGVIGNVSVHLSNGDGTFGGLRNYRTGNGPSGVVLVDITGDGRLDAVTSDKLDNTVSVLPGLPGGAFDAPIHYAVGSGPNGIAVGDLNGDGHLDVVTANMFDNTLSVLLGQPGGTLIPGATIPTDPTPVALAMGDLDQDGHLDVAVVSQGGNMLRIFRGDGSGGLHAGAVYTTSTMPGRVVIGDVDGDPWPDVVVNSVRPPGNANFVDVFRGSSGGLLPKVSYLGGGRDIGIADVNGDGRPDIVTMSSSVVGNLLGTGGGAFAPVANSFRVSQNRALAIADDNGDGKPDLFIAGDWANCVWFVRGLGNNTFAGAEGYGTERTPSALAVADLDGDGTLDVVTADLDTSLVSVLLGVSPGPVPALATLVSAEATGNVVRIAWLTGLVGSTVTVDRSANGASWTSVGQIVPDGSGRLTFEDPDVTPGADYLYRLGFDRGGQTVYAGLVSVHVPVAASLSLAPGSNPSHGQFSVSFSLPDARPARLELYDVSGRRVLTREVGNMGSGTHVLRLGETSALHSGVYWLRLVHPTKTLVARAALVR